jgi:radical SAM protein with 4Fe4S-binding SPASM domain
VIKIQSLWPAIRKNPEDFYNTFEPITDLIAFNPLIDYLQKDSDIKYIDNFVCPQLYQRIVVGADGSVMMCSNDEDNEHIIGDVNKSSIFDIWHSDTLNQVRTIHLQKDGFKEIDICRKCYIPREVESSEMSKVNGRNFHIMNYVNRKQELGE